jgi:hypothetical protein
MVLNQLGGADWLRELLEKKAPMPNKYYENILKEADVADHD